MINTKPQTTLSSVPHQPLPGCLSSLHSMCGLTECLSLSCQPIRAVLQLTGMGAQKWPRKREERCTSSTRHQTFPLATLSLTHPVSHGSITLPRYRRQAHKKLLSHLESSAVHSKEWEPWNPDCPRLIPALPFPPLLPVQPWVSALASLDLSFFIRKNLTHSHYEVVKIKWGIK